MSLTKEQPGYLRHMDEVFMQHGVDPDNYDLLYAEFDYLNSLREPQDFAKERAIAREGVGRMLDALTNRNNNPNTPTT